MRNNNKSQKRKNKNQKPRRVSPLVVEHRLLATSSYVGEHKTRLWVPGPTQLVSTVLTSFAGVYAIGNASTQIGNYTDFSNQWDNYCILGARFRIMCVTPPTPGSAVWFFDASANAAVPVAADEYRDGMLQTNHSMNNNRVWRKQFHVVDNSLLSFRPTTVDYVVGYFKYYTDAARFGTSAANTLLYEFKVWYDVLFKGRKV